MLHACMQGALIAWSVNVDRSIVLSNNATTNRMGRRWRDVSVQLRESDERGKGCYRRKRGYEERIEEEAMRSQQERTARWSSHQHGVGWDEAPTR